MARKYSSYVMPQSEIVSKAKWRVWCIKEIIHLE